ncbi:MAG: beta-ketoacyl synthase chain length factor [Ramlibacter sp.]
MDDWAQAREAFLGSVAAVTGKTRVPMPTSLPAAERRRAGLAVKAAIAVGHQALELSNLAAAELATVFASSGGESVNCHEICAALATSDRVISPTRFHNSVHNAPSGYWSIASRSMATSSVVCAFDGSFAAGLLEAMTQVATEIRPVLLIAYDTDYPEPLLSVRPIPDTLGLALLLSPQSSAYSLGRLTLESDGAFTPDAADKIEDAAFEGMRCAFPAARGLPLLQALALRQDRRVVIDYLDGMQLAIRAQPC